MKKITLFSVLLVLFVFTNLSFSQDKPNNIEHARGFYHLGNGSTDDTKITSVFPGTNNIDPAISTLFDQLQQARMNENKEAMVSIQSQLNLLSGTVTSNQTINDPFKTGMLETTQYFDAQSFQPEDFDYSNTTIDQGGFWSVATFTSNRSNILFAAVTKYAGGASDTLKLFVSYNNGNTWVLKGKYNGFATSVDYRAGELDIEAIVGVGDTIVYAVAGYNYNNKAFSQIAKFDISTGVVSSKYFNGPGALDTDISFYNPRVTSDNTYWSASSTYLYITAARDSNYSGDNKHISYWFGYSDYPVDSFNVVYRNPNASNGFWWYSSSAADTAYLWQDIGYLRVGSTDRIYTVYNHSGTNLENKLYLAYTNTVGLGVTNSFIIQQTKKMLNAKIAANGNNANLCIAMRDFFGPDWDLGAYFTATGGDSVEAFVLSHPEYTVDQSTKLVDVQAIKNSNGGFVFAWANEDGSHKYRRTNNFANGYTTTHLVANEVLGDNFYGGSKAGYLNSSTSDSSLVVWSSYNGSDAYGSTGLQTPVSVDGENNVLPLTYCLQQNYPNPFNPSTTIKFSIPEQAYVTLKIFNSIGQEVATLLNGEKTAGNHSVDFNASKLSSGVYFYRIDSPSFTSTRKMILIK